jgi:hypothetical protein
MLPYVQVSHLPPSASFYSAVTHPLGLRFISASQGAIAYGTTSPTDPSATKPAFEVRVVKDRTQDIKPARLVLSTSSPSVVKDFYAAAIRTHPELKLTGRALTHDGTSSPSSQIQDLDGNIMEVVYIPPADSQPRPGGSTVRHTQSTTDEASRILDWNLDVATSGPSRSVAGGGSTAVARRPSRAADGPEPPYLLRRSVTTSTIEATTPVSRESPSGLGSGVVGAVLGAVAAGAAIGGALTYMSMKNQRKQAPRQEFDAPVFQRRSTFPDPYPDHRPRYIERERTVEKIHYPDQYSQARGPRHYPPSAYTARYPGGGRSREVEELDDRASRLSARQSTSGRTRTRSEAASARQPLVIADHEYQSQAGSKYTATTTPKILMGAELRSQAGSRHSTNLLPEADQWSRAPSRQTIPRSLAHRDPEAETYLSAHSKRSERSDRTESTIRGPRQSVYDTAQSVTYGDVPIRSHAPSKAPTKASAAPSRHSTVQATARSLAPSAARSLAHTAVRSSAPSAATHRTGHTTSRAGTHASARKVPLPESQADWDDNDSIAPSDSISCIGTHR